MTDFADSAAAMRARFEEFEAERQRTRPEREEREQARPAAYGSDRHRRPRRAPRERRTMGEPMGARTAAVGARIAEIRSRQPGDPRGTIAEPLPMGPYTPPFTIAALREAGRA